MTLSEYEKKRLVVSPLTMYNGGVSLNRITESLIGESPARLVEEKISLDRYNVVVDKWEARMIEIARDIGITRIPEQTLDYLYWARRGQKYAMMLDNPLPRPKSSIKLNMLDETNEQFANNTNKQFANNTIDVVRLDNKTPVTTYDTYAKSAIAKTKK